MTNWSMLEGPRNDQLVVHKGLRNDQLVDARSL